MNLDDIEKTFNIEERKQIYNIFILFYKTFYKTFYETFFSHKKKNKDRLVFM